jgi:alpha-amylase
MQNETMLQYFHWYTAADGMFWKQLAASAHQLSAASITSVWLPPAYKTDGGSNSLGYDVYDIYDLGEFEQKGIIRTKYGTKQEYITAVQALHSNEISVYIDVVLNHLAGADESEKTKALKVNPDNRLEVVEEEKEIEVFTKFSYPGRGGQYSAFVWDKNCFTGVDFDNEKKETSVFTILNEYGDGWEDMVDDEKGNYDYLMYSDIEFRNPQVREELKRWGKWYHDIIKFDGVRLDAIKYIPAQFYNEWLDYMREFTSSNLFAVGEFWAPGRLDLFLKYIEATNGRMSLFDPSLQLKLHQASESGSGYDMSAILSDTLTTAKPELSVTLVDNHDTQPLQALEAPVQAWLKPLAYAIILLRQEGYPCVFYPDLFGASYTDKSKDGNNQEIILAKLINY